MFSNHGKIRTHKHNLQIATLLSFVAGCVNVIGYVSIQTLTTNITGHFAFFVDDVLQLSWSAGLVFFIFIMSFFSGAFVSSLLIEIIKAKSKKYIFILPVFIEIVILVFLVFFGEFLLYNNPKIIAVLLLFAMGLQNSLVTRISNAVVRTTHLTGLFTDLGIDIALLFFSNQLQNKNKLMEHIGLRFRIILFFFLGGLIGGVLYMQIQFLALIAPAIILVFGLVFDNIRYSVIILKRKTKHVLTKS